MLIALWQNSSHVNLFCQNEKSALSNALLNGRW